jgi:3-dehydroquinate dehydratase-1
MDCIELRLDSLFAQGLTASELAPWLLRRRWPLILTFRLPQEGGVVVPGISRWRVLRELFLLADGLDLELASRKDAEALLESLWEEEKFLILSVHKMEGPLDTEELKEHLGQFLTWKPDCAKIAFRAERPEDLLPVAHELVKAQQLPWTAMAIGPWALFSRVFFCALGSRLLYGSLDAQAAPGQPTLSSLREAVERLGLSSSIGAAPKQVGSFQA